MKKLLALCVAAAIAVSTVPARAAEASTTPPGELNTAGKVLTTGQALAMLAGLRNLDGHQVVTKQNGQDVSIVVPWNFGNGALRLSIAANISLLGLVETANEKALAQIRSEVFKGQPAREGSPEMAEFTRQFNEMMARPVPGALEKLERIKASALKLDVNEIPGTTLFAIDLILDR